jgi:hypothetical protein
LTGNGNRGVLLLFNRGRRKKGPPFLGPAWLFPPPELPSDLEDSESLVPGDVFGVVESSVNPRVPLRTEFVDTLPGSSKLI